MDFLQKPRTFRDRKKDYARKQKFKENELHHPLHEPYKRDNTNLKHSVVIDGRGEEDIDVN